MIFWTYAHPRRYTGDSRPENFGLKAEPLKLRAADGVELDAWLVPNKAARAALVVCHGYPMDKSDVLGMTAFLARSYTLLYFDFRATGRSGGFFSTGGARETRDIAAAAKHLEERGFSGRVGAFGFSMGAASLLLAGDGAGLKARALDSPYASLSDELDHIFPGWGAWRRPLLALMKLWNFALTGISIGSVSPERAAAGLKTPLLLIHGDADRQVLHGHSKRIAAANPAAEFWTVPGAGHGEARYLAGAEYERRVLAFFGEHLK